MTELMIQNVSPFMGKLFSSECFDSFLLEEGTVRTAVTWTLDSRLNRSFYSEEEWNDPEERRYEFASWSELRPLCRELIKGKKAPVGFRFVLRLRPEFLPRTLGEENISLPIGALLMTIRYDGGQVCIVTGISYSDFTLDRSAEKLWDRTVCRFLEHHGIAYDAG
ncbi:DUF5721 family protein [Lachnoclostridium sp. Marseille-P6806]|uniref:DUF5721 family protein n=1 Tax=Lachnoclostridium sp. Marseille-P6806 TaxID=2364793 RepID=UPI00102F6E9C|nr:DUF5721 family protein [Lachnoclostridium sp. Marseille-P6806]